jgi:hypothetical protein
MATPDEIDELREMCTLLFLELQAIRRRLDIEPFGLSEVDADRQAFKRDMKRQGERLRQLRQLTRSADAAQAHASQT